MRRLLMALACSVAAMPAVGCHCVTGKCDCVSDALTTHPYATPALAPLQSEPQLPGAGSIQFSGGQAPTGAPPVVMPMPASSGKEVLAMPKDVTER